MYEPSERKAWCLAVLIAVATLATDACGQTALTPGHLVVVRVGNGSGSLSNAAHPVFLDELSTSGTPGTTLALPTAVNGTQFRLTNSGTATSEGFLNLSENGQYLVLTGYDAAAGTASVASTATAGASPVARVVARVDRNGLVDTSTALSAYSGTNIRSAASLTGNEFWVSGPTNGVSYVAALGATGSTQLASSPNNIRVVRISGGQLYASSASGAFHGVSAVGSGLPASAGQTIALLPGFPTTTGPSSYDFWFADASTLYVADDRANASGGIQKWSFTGSAWALQYTLSPGLNVGCRGLTGVIDATGIVLWATTGEGSLNRVVTVTDTGPGSAFTTLAMAAPNTIFRGIRRIPLDPSVTVVGAGCAGSGGLVPTLSTTQLPSLGNLGFRVDIAQAAPNAPAFLFVALGTDVSGTPIGGGCNVYLDYPSLLLLMSYGLTPAGPGFTDATGARSFLFPIPNQQLFAGLDLGLQAGINDAAAPLGFTVTNALHLFVN